MRTPFLGVLVLLTACEAPPVFPGSDVRQQTPTSRIDGQVVASTTARGKVVLFLYDAAHPPPPTGTGRPVTFTVISREALFGMAADGAAGPFTAPFTFSLLPQGQYLIRAFIDANDDFIPWYGVTADVNQGDVGGGAVDPLTRQFLVIDVNLDRPTTDVPVSISDSAKVPLDRPVFQPVGGLDVVTVQGAPVMVQLQAQPIDEGVIHQAHPAFILALQDDDGDGLADLVDGKPVVKYPRLVVRKTAREDSVAEAKLAPLFDENDLDKNGLVDDAGVDYALLDTGMGDGLPDVVVLGGGIDPSEHLPRLLDGDGHLHAGPLVVTTLTLKLLPAAFDARNPLAPRRLQSVPVGRYAVNLIQQTGQTWRTPNELAATLADEYRLPLVASQSFYVDVK